MEGNWAILSTVLWRNDAMRQARKSNGLSGFLLPPVNPTWITAIIDEAFNRSEGLGLQLKKKKKICWCRSREMEQAIPICCTNCGQ